MNIYKLEKRLFNYDEQQQKNTIINNKSKEKAKATQAMTDYRRKI